MDHLDPLGIGRLLVTVPAIPEESRRNWAMPCVPYAGADVGFFALPPIGANVWVEFEEGNPNRPIWCGCFWEEGEVPDSRPEKKVFRTTETAITLEDTSGRGGITLETSEGVKIVLSPAGIELSSGEGSIRLEGKKVSVNGRVLDGI
ncbi:phage baseplate assembly protein V [Methanosarcina sp. KYL-1]|uniref:phage baseplate assembly protein V n=1 Tax=Methanosarcina sp. KYL-1 TaxID=2602068 RepID=UPI002100E9A3|nr:phage baseplate assembly protein V [Methanosarcina sp. KYL-1]